MSGMEPGSQHYAGISIEDYPSLRGERIARHQADRASLIEARGRSHGTWAIQSLLAQELKSLLRWYPSGRSKPQQEALEAIAVKLARIVAGDPNHEDHWRDIAGYAELGRSGCANKKSLDNSNS